MYKLAEFLNRPVNSLYRECLLKHKLLFDIQLAFANNGRRLLIYESEYDQDGFDLIFDDLNLHKHFQVKSIVSPSKTSSFEIHRNLLRPSLKEIDYYPVSPDSFGIGYGGGVLLIEVVPNASDLSVNYYFTDGLILSAFSAGIFRYKLSVSQGSVEKCFQKFADPTQYGGKIKITKPCFIKFVSLSKLFSYCGFQIEDCGGARFNLLRAVARKCGHSNEVDSKLNFEPWKKILHRDFVNLIQWEDLIHKNVLE